MKCANKKCEFCSPSREQWTAHWFDSDYTKRYFLHRGTEVKRLDLPAIASGLAGGTNETEVDLSTKLRQIGYIRK